MGMGGGVIWIKVGEGMQKNWVSVPYPLCTPLNVYNYLHISMICVKKIIHRRESISPMIALQSEGGKG